MIPYYSAHTDKALRQRLGHSDRCTHSHFHLYDGGERLAISLNGRHLACSFSDSTVNVWEVANRMGGPAFAGASPITRHRCTFETKSLEAF